MADVKLASRLLILNESPTLALNARAKQMAVEGKTIYNLTAGELSTDTPDYIQSAVSKKLSSNKYTPVAGLPELRQAIADHASIFYGLHWIKPENVVVTAGAKPALFATFLSLIDEGDEVILPTPAWVSYIDLIQLAGGKVITPKLTADYDLDVEAICSARSPKTKAIVLNSPHNPTGAIFSKTAVEALSKKLKGSGIIVISDDIYSQLTYANDFFLIPKAGFENLVIINGISKSQALTGWRLGYLIAQKAIAEASTALLSHITGNAPLPSQYAALEAIRRHDLPPASTIKDLENKKTLTVNKLSAITGLKTNTPGGAFYVFLDLRNLTDNSARWCEELLVTTGVALVPGEAFEAPGFARLTFSGDEDVLKGGLEKIKSFIEGRSSK